MSSYSEYDDRPELIKKRAKTLAVRNVTMWLVCALFTIGLALDTANNIVSFDTRSTLLDCVEADGECYQEGQQRTGEAVTGIVVGTKQVIVETLACNNQLPNATPQALEACVDKRLKEKSDERQSR